MRGGSVYLVYDEAFFLVDRCYTFYLDITL